MDTLHTAPATVLTHGAADAPDHVRPEVLPAPTTETVRGMPDGGADLRGRYIPGVGWDYTIHWGDDGAAFAARVYWDGAGWARMRAVRDTPEFRGEPADAAEGCSPPCARGQQAEQRLADRTRALELEARELRAALAQAQRDREELARMIRPTQVLGGGRHG